MENLLDPSAPEFYPQFITPIPQVYYPTPPPTYYSPPPQATTEAAASRAVVLSTVPRDVTEYSLIQSMAAFGGVRSIETSFLLPDGIVTVHFYDLRSAQVAVAEIREQHVRRQSRLGHQYLYGGCIPPLLEENLGAAGSALPYCRGLIDGQAVWAQFAAESLDVLNQGSLFVTVSEPAISSENVRDIFQNFGPIKVVRESPTKPRHKIVEFFDVRDAARALNELNGLEIGGRRFSVEFYRAGHDQFSWSYRQSRRRSGEQNLLLPPRLARNQGAAVLKRNEAKISNVSRSGKDSNEGGKRSKGSRNSSSYPSSSSSAPSSSKQQQQLSKKEWKRSKNRNNRRDIDASRFQFKEGDYESGSSSSAASSCRDSRTTVMIKNIPNKYSQKLLLNMLDSHCIHCNEPIGDDDRGDEPLSAYDFVYLPIDFNNKCNVGYGFVNLTSPEAAVRLHKAFHLQPWEVFNSRKICEVTYARLQGLEALKEHFNNSKFACDVDEYLPAVLEPPRDGRQLTEPLPIGGRGSGQADPSHGVRNRGYEKEGGDGGSIDETCGGISNLEL